MSGKRKKQNNGGKNRGGGKRQHHIVNPKRGGPGILFSCESIREHRCKREGLDILRYYHNKYLETNNKNCRQELDDEGNTKIQTKSIPNNDKDNEKKDMERDEEEQLKEPEEEQPTKKLTLDEELDKLRHEGKKNTNNKQKNSDFPFEFYDTGCRGTVFVICTLPECSLIQSATKPTATTVREEVEDEEEKEPSTKKQKSNENSKETIMTTNDTRTKNCWDALDTVRCVFNDIMNENAQKKNQEDDKDSKNDDKDGIHYGDIPSSRFVTRMIPIQVTCFASLKEIEFTTQTLLDNLLASLGKETETDTKTEEETPPTTFGIYIKRRNCSNVTRDDIISTIGAIMDNKCPKWKVNLSSPDYRIQIEICRTLCGVSIFHKSFYDPLQNFNISEVRNPGSTNNQKKKEVDKENE